MVLEMRTLLPAVTQMNEKSVQTRETHLYDPYGRALNSLRISVTQRCNFNCFFCHREGELNPKGEISVNEIKEIVSVASDLGMRRFKLTGGEPLLRPEIVDIVREIRPYAEEVSLTSNGYLMEKYASKLKDAGLRRVNISLHSSDPDTFKKITGNDGLSEVKRGIAAAVESDLNPVKINMVVLNGYNVEEIPSMIELTKNLGAILQLIEFQPIQAGTQPYWNQFYYDMKSIEEMLSSRSETIRERPLHMRKQYHLKDGGVVEVVKPMHNSRFCTYCSRLRLTSDGRLKPCLMRNDNLVDIVSLIRSGETREVLVGAFKEAVSRRHPYWRE
jgi:cyclic pyranopterin phosphate synthase